MLTKTIGFTLLELMVSIGIFAVILGIVIVNFRGGQWRDELVSSAEIVQSAIREAQTLTLTGQTITCGGETVVPGGYGVRFEIKKNAIRFADCAVLTEPREPADGIYENSKDNTMPSSPILSNVEISELKVDNAPKSPFDLVFSPGKEIVLVDGASDKNKVTIVLTHKKSNRTVEVRVQPNTGQIFIGPVSN